MDDYFTKYMNNCSESNRNDAVCNSIPLNLRGVAYCSAMAHVQNETLADKYYMFLLNKYMSVLL